MARRAWRYGLLGLAAAVVLAIGAGAVFLARFNPNSLKPRIEAAVKQATGRDLALNGPIGLKWSLWPTVELRDVAFANPPGYSRPQMATLGRLDLQLAVLPLLRGRFEIARLILLRPDILLEQDAQGRPNWRFTPAPAPGAAPPAGAPPSAGSKSSTQISFHDVQIEDGTLAWRDDRTGKTAILAVKQLTAQSASPGAPLTLAADAAYNGVAFRLGGQVGPLARLQQPDAGTPWPVKLTLAAAGATLSVDGALTHPLQGSGYNLTLDGTIPDLTALAPLLPGVRLPPLHDVHLATKISDSGGPVPHVARATLHLGAADLGAYVGGLRIVSVDIDAPKQNQPVRINARVTMADTPVTLTATVGAPAALLTGQPAAPVPVDLTLQAANASLTVKGAVAHPETLSGADLALDASIPDLSLLSPLAHRRLPAVTRIAFQGQLTDAPGGFLHGAALHDMTLTTADGDLSGNIAVASGPPPALTGTLHAARIDADALLAAAGRPVTAPPPPAAGSPARPAAPPPPRAASAGRLFPDTPIPFALLRQANADLAVSVVDLKSGGADYRSINLHVVLQGGKLRIDPLSATLPEGPLTASLNVDATAPAPPVAVTLHAPGLEVAPLLAAAGLPGYASGKLEIYANLHGAGNTPHAIAAGLDGTLGLAMQNGTIDAQLLNRLLGPVLQKANLLGMLSHGGSTSLRCFALRADARHGVATLRTLLLDSSLLTMDATGSVNLGEETLALQLRPQGRIAGTGIVVPLRVTGPVRSPNVAVNALGTAESNAGTVAGAVLGSATPLGLLGGLVGADKLLGGGSGDPCAGPLALARGQAPPPARAPNAGGKPKPSSPGALLHELFH
ncbi:MAG TPA: AsmA family protein [Acetobacteraceae bacterium]|nr:AsmA family protein [Acetobacteraceae bacterium]